MSKVIKFVRGVIPTILASPWDPKGLEPAIAEHKAAQTFRDSQGKQYSSEMARDAAQKKLDRKAKFPAQTTDTGALRQFRTGKGVGKPKVTNPVVATASSGSGVTIAGA